MANDRINDSLEFSHLVLDSVPESIAVLNPEGIIIWVNAEWRRFADENNLPKSKNFYLNQSYFDLNYRANLTDSIEKIQAINKDIREVIEAKRDIFRMEYSCHSPDKKRWFNMLVVPLLSFNQTGQKDSKRTVLVTHINVTDLNITRNQLQKSNAELELKQQIAEVLLLDGEEDVYADLLDIILNDSGSSEGYFGYIDEKGDLICPSMTHHVWDKCEIPDKDIRFPRGIWGGLWGRSLIEKRSFIRNSGLHAPEGHIKLQRAMVVPIICREKLIGQIAVGNKPADYTAEDLMNLETVAAFVAPILEIRLKKYREECRRKQLEKELQDSEQQKELILNASREFIAYYDTSLRIIWTNKAAADSVGKVMDEMVGFHCYELWHGRNIPCENCPVLRALKSGVPEEGEQQTPDGRHYMLRAYPVFDEKNDLVGLAEFGEDITDQVQYQQAIKESEERFELAMQATTDGVFDWDLRTNNVYYSPSWKRMLGYEDHEVKSAFSEWERLTRPEDVERTLQLIDDHLKGKTERMETEIKMKHKDGHFVDILARASAVQDSTGKAYRFVGTHVDISRLKQAQEALRESERNYRMLADYTHDWEYWLDPDGSYKYVSPSCKKISGYRADDFYNNPELFFEIILSKFRSKVRSHFEKKEIEKGTVHHFNFPIRHKNGEIRWLEHTCVSVFDEYGDLQGRRGNNRDITARKQAEEEREKLRSQLYQQQKLESIGLLASGVAHEINNPLNGIINYAQLIESRIENKSLSEFAKGIMYEGERVAKIVRNLLSFAREDTEPKSLTSIKDVITDALNLFGAVFSKENIKIIVDIQSGNPMIYCRKFQLEQVFINMLTNARYALNNKYANLSEKKQIAIIAEKKRKYLYITVEDNGSGVAQKHQSKIFDPFFTTKPRGKGTGLGLSVSYGIIKEHSGELTVESVEGQYTRFMIKLPMTNSENS